MALEIDVNVYLYVCVKLYVCACACACVRACVRVCARFCMAVYLVVLQQDEAEVELAEGQLQVLDVAVLAALLLRKVEHRLALAQARRGVALALGVQRGLQLILERGEATLGLRQLFYKTAEQGFTERIIQSRGMDLGTKNRTRFHPSLFLEMQRTLNDKRHARRLA